MAKIVIYNFEMGRRECIICLGIRDIVPTSQEDGALGLIEEGAMSTDHNRQFIDVDSVLLVGGGDLNGDTTGGEEPIHDPDEGDQQDAANQSLQECGPWVERAEGKTREEATRNCWRDARSAHGLSGFDERARGRRSDDYRSAGGDGGPEDRAGWNGEDSGSVIWRIDEVATNSISTKRLGITMSCNHSRNTNCPAGTILEVRR